MQYTYSIMIPVYQVTPYLRKCLDSLLPQLPDHVQVIIIDDGSTDGSREICKEYAQQYSQIELILKAHGGVASARNIGLQHAQGEYLLWVDSDDWVVPDWFARIDHILSQTKPDMLIYDHMRFEESQLIPQHYNRPSGLQDTTQVLDDVIRDIRINSALWNKAIRNIEPFRSILQFDEALLCLEDYAILHKLIVQMKNIEYLPEPLYVYRIHAKSLVGTLNLDIAYRSFEVSLQRANEIPKNLSKGFHSIGIVIQAKAFCRNYCIAGQPRAYRPQYLRCKNALIRSASWILREKEWPFATRIKTLLWASSLVGLLYKKKILYKSGKKYL